MFCSIIFRCSFFFNDTATTEIYTLSLHDALPISDAVDRAGPLDSTARKALAAATIGDRQSTRLNSSHGYISYAVFCLTKKNQQHTRGTTDKANHQTKSTASEHA